MKTYIVFRLDRFQEKVKLPSGESFDLTRIQATVIPRLVIWAISPEEALKTAQADYTFPRRLCVAPLE